MDSPRRRTVYRDTARRLCWLLAAALCLLLSGVVRADSVALDRGWQYRWGDSPLAEDGVPRWTREAEGWQDIAFPADPPGREGRENLWLRVALPDGQWRDPVLFISSVDLIVEAYVDGQRIYGFGTFDAQGRGHFAGWPWHAIPLPPDGHGRHLYLRIFSNYKNIGLWGDVRVMERAELLQRLTEGARKPVVVSVLALVLALLGLVGAAVFDERRTFLAISLLAAVSGGSALAETEARLLMFDAPLFWEYVEAGSYYLTPIAMALLLEQWFTGKRRLLYAGLRRFFSLYLLGALGLGLSGWVALSDTYPVFDILFLLALPLLLVPAARAWPKATPEQRAMLLALAVHVAMLLVSMGVAHAVLPWVTVPLSWGALAFSLVIMGSALRHYAQTRRELHRLNCSLEAKVKARTLELETMARQDRRRVHALAMEGERRGLMAEFITALQRCLRLDDALSLLAEYLPRLCEPIGGSLYLNDGEHYRLSFSWSLQAAPPTLSRTPSSWPEPSREDGLGWCFPIVRDHPRLGAQGLAVLVLDSPEEGDAMPFDDGMLYRLVRSAVEKINLTLSIVSLHEELSRFSYEDALTGLRNRRYLDESLEREIALAQRQGTSLSLVLCDIDHFKRFNDTHGHAAGDQVLRLVARQLGAVVRQSDIACRYGGEEFVILMPAASAQVCVERVEALRRQVSRTDIEHAGSPLGRVTLSAGVASWPDQVADPRQLLVAADRALYRAKQRGRDRVELASSA